MFTIRGERLGAVQKPRDREGGRDLKWSRMDFFVKEFIQDWSRIFKKGGRGGGAARFFRIFRSRGFWTVPKDMTAHVWYVFDGFIFQSSGSQKLSWDKRSYCNYDQGIKISMHSTTVMFFITKMVSEFSDNALLNACNACWIHQWVSLQIPPSGYPPCFDVMEFFIRDYIKGSDISPSFLQKSVDKGMDIWSDTHWYSVVTICYR